MTPELPVLYFISGLGADKRVFEKLELPGFNIKHISWLLPKAEEPIAEYAARMAESITDPNFLLIGLSFGGIMSMEIAKIRAVPGVILLSSIATKAGLPTVFPALIKTKISQWLPDSWLTMPNPGLDYAFGIKDADNKETVANMIRDNDPAYIRWALQAIGHWQNMEIAAPLFQIHGDADKLFPVGKIKRDFVIPNGEHIMVMDQAAEVSKAILKGIDTLSK